MIIYEKNIFKMLKNHSVISIYARVTQHLLHPPARLSFSKNFKEYRLLLYFRITCMRIVLAAKLDSC